MSPEITIIEKIEKLLRLGTSANKNEAMVAMKKARELMLKHHIEENRLNLTGNVNREIVIKKFNVKQDWEALIYTIVSKNMRCDAYLTTVRKNTGLIREISILGYPEDVEAVRIMSVFLIDVCKIGLRTVRQSLSSKGKDTTQGLAPYYRTGFTVGLKEAFMEQNKNEEFSLMLITPEDVKKKMQNLNLKTQTVNNITVRDRDFTACYEQGKKDGFSAGGKRLISS